MMLTRQRAPNRGSMVQNVMHLGFGQIGTTILTIALNAAMGRTLRPSDFGLLYLLMSIATFAYVVVDWGHGAVVIREAARHPHRAGILLGSAMAVRTIAALLASVVAVSIAWLLGYDVRTRVLTGVLILGWLPQYLGLSFGWVFRAFERMDRDALLNVASRLVTLIASVVCLAWGGRLQGLLLAWSAAALLTLAIAISMYRRLRLPTICASISTARELLRDGAPLMVMSLAISIEPFFNANILYKLASPEVVGWYGAAWNIAGTLIAPATILGASMYPRLVTAAGDAAEFKYTFEISFRLLLVVGVLGAVGTYLYADVPVGFIYGLQKFAPAAETLRAFAPVLFLLCADLFLCTVIVAAGKAGRLAGAKLASVALTTGLLFVLVPYCQTRFGNGGLGVMYAMTIGELLMLAVACALIREAIDGRVVSDACRSLIAGAATILIMRQLPAFAPVFAIPICVAVFGGLAVLVSAVTPADIRMLRAAFRRPSPALP